MWVISLGIFVLEIITKILLNVFIIEVKSYIIYFYIVFISI